MTCILPSASLDIHPEKSRNELCPSSGNLWICSQPLWSRQTARMVCLCLLPCLGPDPEKREVFTEHPDPSPQDPGCHRAVPATQTSWGAAAIPEPSESPSEGRYRAEVSLSLRFGQHGDSWGQEMPRCPPGLPFPLCSWPIFHLLNLIGEGQLKVLYLWLLLIVSPPGKNIN